MNRKIDTDLHLSDLSDRFVLVFMHICTMYIYSKYI